MQAKFSPAVLSCVFYRFEAFLTPKLVRLFLLVLKSSTGHVAPKGKRQVCSKSKDAARRVPRAEKKYAKSLHSKESKQ